MTEYIAIDKNSVLNINGVVHYKSSGPSLFEGLPDAEKNSSSDSGLLGKRRLSEEQGVDSTSEKQSKRKHLETNTLLS